MSESKEFMAEWLQWDGCLHMMSWGGIALLFRVVCPLLLSISLLVFDMENPIFPSNINDISFRLFVLPPTGRWRQN